MKEQGIEEIFKKAFDHFESDVDPNVWTNVQQAINAPAAAPANQGANSSIAGKAGALAGKLGVKGIIAIVAAVTGVSVGAYFLMSENASQKTVPVTNQSVAPVQIVTSQQAPVINQPSIANTTVAPQAEKIVSEQKVKAEKKQAVGSPAYTSESKPSAGTPSKNTPSGNPPAAAQPTPAKASPPVIAPTPVAAKTDEPKPADDADATANRTYQNDFADIKDYLLAAPVQGKAALPNIFTPNGDGNNDVFMLRTKNLKSLMVTVFDRSGNQIYQWNSVEGSWDGNLADGRPAPSGNYYYSFLAETVDGKICMNHSTLVLKRQ